MIVLPGDSAISVSRDSVWFNGEVAEETAAALCESVSDIHHEYGKVKLHINSSGGLADAAYGVFWAIRKLGQGTVAIVDGLAASSAVLIYLATETRYISPTGCLYVHHAHQSTDSEFEETKRSVQELEEFNTRLCSLMAKRCKKRPAAMKKLLTKRSLLVGKEAIRAGFAHEIRGEIT